ncbi:SseB family protein [Jannaschia sp. W003]|uniref:SseB family protein n=1 Tax=Jannaschia sp. W003 TaxID=2867012 RepID=UPI0021A4D91E|nr:SseB family protein [Jannaschia sp. W003]UWQ20974.1 SseB family protein [Jannaschia sp. W003]
MTDLTPLDRAHLRAEETGAPADRLAFWSRLAEAELSLLLGEADAPQVFEIEGQPFALAFDRPHRLAAFAGSAATATLSGRALAKLLSDNGFGLGLNLEDAPSAQLLPPEAIRWLADTLAEDPTESAAHVERIEAPGALPDALLEALDAKLPLAAGAARHAYLARAVYEGGAANHVLAFVDPAPGAESPLARAAQEALAFSGLEAGALDVIFPAATSPIAASLARHGLRIELPKRAPRIGMALGEDEEEGPPILR